MYEDSAVEMTAFAPGVRVFCIASAGCTAFDLAARGDDVTAVDVNPAQVDYVRRRLAGGPREDGRVERRLSRLRRLAPLVGWSTGALESFCRLDRPEVQVEFWRRRLDTRRFRISFAAALSPLPLRTAYRSAFTTGLPPRFDLVLRRRLERGFRRHANLTNPHASALLLGRPRPVTPAPLTLTTADAVEFLETCRPGSFGGLSLSNILDGASARYGERLLAAVRRAAAPGAVVIVRSFAEPTKREEARWAADDRALIWGRITVERL